MRKADYTDAKKYSVTVMMDIMDILKDNKIEFKATNNSNEIRIKDKSASGIKDLILKNTKIPQNSLSILIDIIPMDSDVYIRQKVK